MAFDAHANFAITAVTVAPVPALSGTSLTVTAGSSALFPAVPFNCTVYPSTSAPISTNAEIVRVTNIVGDVWTITRTQEGSTAMPIAIGYLIANTITKKVFTDMESAMIQGISAVGGSASGGTVVFDNSPTVTFGRAGQTITASVATAGAGGAAISAGTQSQNTGTIIFSNSNGATFGLNAGTLTLSYTVPGATVFSNSNNVTFGLAGSTVTASVTVAQSTQPIAASASNGSFLFSTLGFSNANGVTFGTSAGNIVTASVGAGGAPGTISAGTASVALGLLVFSNSNNVSFGLNGSTVTASASQSQSTQPVAVSAINGSYLFSTLVFNDSHNMVFSTVAGGSIIASAQHNIKIFAGTTNARSTNFSFVNSNGVSFGIDTNGTITASIATSLTAINLSAGTTSNNASAFTFANANNVTFGMNGNTITASATMASTQGSINFSAGTTSGNLQSVVFSNSNRVSFGLNGSTVTAQHALNFSGGTTSNNVSDQLVFSNSNNVSFGLNGSTLTATATVASTQASVVFGAVGSTNTGSQIIFSNSNNVTFGLNASTITASVTVAIGSIAAGTTFGTLGQVSFNNANGVTFTMNGQNISASIATSLTNIRVSAGTTSNNLSALTFDNAGGITFGLNGSVITAVAPAGAPSPVNFSAGTTSSNLGSVVFSNSNGISFGLNGATITASGGGGAESNNINLLGANTAGNTTASGSTLGFSGLNLTLSGTNASQIVFSVPATSSLVATGGLNLSTNGSTISISLSPIAQYEPIMPMGTNSTTFLQPIGQWWFIPFVPDAPLSGGRLNFMTQFGSTSQLPLGTTSASWGVATSGQKALRYQYSLSAALWSLGAGTNSTRIESFWSNQHSFEISHNVSISAAAAASITVSMGITMSGISNINSDGGVTTTTYGGSSTINSSSVALNSTANSSILSIVNNMLSNSLILPVPFNTTINAGNYFLGVAWSTASSTTGSSQVGFSVINAVGLMQQSNITGYRMFGRTTTNVSSQIFPGRGAYSASSLAPAATIAFTDIRTKATNAIHYCNWVNSNAITI